MTFHVDGLAPSITSNDLAMAFQRLIGPVSEVVLKRDPLTKLSRGFGFVTLQRPEHASALLLRMKQDPAFLTQAFSRDPAFLDQSNPLVLHPAIQNGDGSYNIMLDYLYSAAL